MSLRDWLIVLVLTVAALTVGWPNFRESSLGLLLTGRSDHCSGRGRGAGGLRGGPGTPGAPAAGRLAVIRCVAALAPSPRLP